MPVSDGHNENSRILDAIHDAEGITTQQIVTSAMNVGGPRLRVLLDRGDRCVYFFGEPEGCGAAVLRVPPCSGLSLLDGLVEVLNRAAHVERPRESCDELLTTESFS